MQATVILEQQREDEDTMIPTQVDSGRYSEEPVDVDNTKTESQTRVEDIALADIAADLTLQPRVALDQDTIDAYAESMTSQADFPPVTLFDDGKSKWLVDGYHRY